MEFDERLDYAIHLMAMEYNIDKAVADSIVSNFDIDDAVIERYEEELAEKEEELQRDYEYNQEHYNDGWNGHIGV